MTAVADMADLVTLIAERDCLKAALADSEAGAAGMRTFIRQVEAWGWVVPVIAIGDAKAALSATAGVDMLERVRELEAQVAKFEDMIPELWEQSYANSPYSVGRLACGGVIGEPILKSQDKLRYEAGEKMFKQ